MNRYLRKTKNNTKKRHSSCPNNPQSSRPSLTLKLTKAFSHKAKNSPYKRKRLFKLRKRPIPLTLDELSEQLAPMALIGKRQTSGSYLSDSEPLDEPLRDSRVMDEEDSSFEKSSDLKLGVSNYQLELDGAKVDDSGNKCLKSGRGQ